MQSYTFFANFGRKTTQTFPQNLTERPSAFNLKRFRGHLNGELVLRGIIKGPFSKINPKIEYSGFFSWTAGANPLECNFAILIKGGRHFDVQTKLFCGCGNNFNCSDDLRGRVPGEYAHI